MAHRTTRSLLALAILAAAALAPAADCESLWQRGKANAVSLVADNRARRVGDIVTIAIEERQRVKNKEKVDTEKSSSSSESLEFEPADEFAIVGDVLDWLLPIELEADREFESETDYSKEGTFSTLITAIVLDVQPNGNLVIEGRRKVVLDGEEKWMTVSGIVRYFDVRFDNTVASSHVAAAKVSYASCGPLAINTERGWLDRAIDFIWPF